MGNSKTEGLRARLGGLSRALLPLALRGTTLTFAYGTTLVIVLLSLWLVTQKEDAATTSFLLGYYLICTIVAGIDPGSAKALVIDRQRRVPVTHSGLIGTSLAKALLGTPVFAALWIFASKPDLPLVEVVIWTALLSAVGFVTTNYRIILDFGGRHTAAIWLKQGSLSLAVAVVVAALLLGASASTGIALAIAARVLWIALFVFRIDTDSQDAETGDNVSTVRQWLTLPGWPALAAVSVLAALSGSLDRIVVLQALDTDAAANYFLLVEVLSKFWLLSYIMAPILFAHRARGNGGAGLAKAVLLVSVVGAAFLAGLAVLLFGWTEPLDACCAEIGRNGFAVMVLAAGYVINAVTQLLSSDLQARGMAKRLAIFSLGMLIISYPLFTFAAGEYALMGIAWAWLARVSAEFVFYAILARQAPDLDPDDQSETSPSTR